MSHRLNRETAHRTNKRPAKVLQFGDGNFLRGFVEWMVDEMNEKTSFNGDVIIVAPLRKGRPTTPDQQDGLYHLVLNGIVNGKATSQTKLITCVSDQIDPYHQHSKFLDSAKDPDIKFITSNSTEAGIVFEPGDTDSAGKPESFPAKFTQWLFARFKHFGSSNEAGVFVVPCELIADNATVLKNIIIQYASLWNLPDDFTRWIDECNTFCNTLVDRIVTGFPKDKADEYFEAIGYEDHRMVAAEPYCLWVIEDKNEIQHYFPSKESGLPVSFVADINPYRTRKVRILNGAHTAMMAIAYLSGLRTVREAIENQTIKHLIETTIQEEVIPTLPLPANDLRVFAGEVIERFQNPYIRHELASIALNSISKFKVRVLPSILEYRKLKNELPSKLMYCFAALLLFYRGTWKGDQLPLKDDPKVIEFFESAWNEEDESEAIRIILGNSSLWGEDLSTIEGFTESTLAFVREIQAL